MQKIIIVQNCICQRINEQLEQIQLELNVIIIIL